MTHVLENLPTKTELPCLQRIRAASVVKRRLTGGAGEVGATHVTINYVPFLRWIRKSRIMTVVTAFTLPVIFSGSAFCEPGASASSLTIHTYSAAPEGFLSNSYIIGVENDVIVIDAQFSPQEAKNVAKLVRSSGKRLSRIVITHPHPDHYYGLEVLGAQYNEAEILGGPLTINEVKNSLKFWAGSEAVGDTFGPTRLLSANAATMNDIRAQYIVLSDGESIENTIIYIPSQQILFVGDLASNGIHMWLAEGRFDNWLAQLTFLRSLGTFSAIYPGHGPVEGMVLLEEAEKYITDFQYVVRSSRDVDTAIETMLRLYPEYKMPEILESSVRSAMASRNLAN